MGGRIPEKRDVEEVADDKPHELAEDKRGEAPPECDSGVSPVDLAHDKEEELKTILTQDEIDYAKSLLKWISVQDDAKYAKNEHLSYMHDVTEGGLLGAVYEAHQGIKKGIEIICENVPVLDVTNKICDYFNIKPFRLISSGSMLIISSDSSLEKKFEGSDIKLTKIGTVKGEDPIIITDDIPERILPPYADELYKVI